MNDHQQTQFNKQQSPISRLRNIAVTNVLLLRRYRKPQMAGTIFDTVNIFIQKNNTIKMFHLKKIMK